MTRLRALIFIAGLLMLAAPAFGQKVDLNTDHVAMTELAVPWRFHTGDDATWAKPEFDDSGWSLVRPDKSWNEQGYPQYGGAAWYRIEIILPANAHGLSVYLPFIWGSCQIYANGRLIGQNGELPPRPKWVASRRLQYMIPDDLTKSGRMELAIRVWDPPQYGYAIPGGLIGAPRLGDTQTIFRWRELLGRETYWANSASVIELFANFLGAIASLGMFLLRRKEREYLWFGIFLLNWSAYHVVLLTWAFEPMPVYTYVVLRSCATVLGYLISLEFFTTLLKQRRSWPYITGAVSMLIAAIGYFINISNPTSVGDAFLSYAQAIGIFCLAALIFRAWRAGSMEAGILLIPEAWVVCETVVQRITAMPYFVHQAWAQTFVHYINYGFNTPFPYYIPSLRGDVTNLVVLLILILRYARSRADEERLESELEAARTVQKVLIPSEFPVIPGFHVEAVYKPASQVGGDFFQVISVSNGSALVAVGDVSGKGMPAAMTVSLLVGTFRTLAHYTREPGEILRAMNQRMIARSAGGFTTCVVLRVDPDGNVTAANAGHLAPYLNGKELAVESGLPLGLDVRTTYAESRFRLKPREQITLMTDGVPEARNVQGELFGFENTAAITGKSAEDIAETARQFGQNDDVTVVKLTWEPALLSPTASLIFSEAPIVP